MTSTSVAGAVSITSGRGHDSSSVVSRPVKLISVGPLIRTWLSFSHSTVSTPAVQHDVGFARRKAAPIGRDQRRASTGAAGQRDPGAPLPDTDANSLGGNDLRDFDIGALRKHRVPFELRT